MVLRKNNKINNILLTFFILINDKNIKNNEIGIPIGFSEAKEPQIKAKIIKFIFFFY